ncbi:Polyketide cyclase / dehydrase and lipid transport [Aliiroseovarius halocynthiae]|uniref:SRPBCC family protein n=1 Tax=Aliiroseovarius halocynthiae TaxID=985055 RepID=A0A545SYE0_9RHOB|nr:SRPBCC family protein [Aliiroseovarius halocynthiae]TQV69985.1 SRPBCC family protein [Aliiroseovarius halocynthiae]SMR70651.1 Polyketide cyclase / dehydrase and lipid transport [Aliiroseovarius halocynthiae]
MKLIKVIAVGAVIAVVLLIGLSQIGGQMTTLHHQIKIDAPQELVFATLADLETVDDYNPHVQTAKYISENRTGVGASRECFLGAQGTVLERVTAVEDGKSISMEMYEHNWPLKYMRWTTRLETEGDSTLVSQTLEYEMKFGLLGALMDRLMMRGKMDSTMNEVFNSMRDYIEKIPV